jgi:hypothetical protein
VVNVSLRLHIGRACGERADKLFWCAFASDGFFKVGETFLAVHQFTAERHFPPRRQPAKFLGDSASRDLAMQPFAISNVGQGIIESFRGFIQEFDLFGVTSCVCLVSRMWR